MAEENNNEDQNNEDPYEQLNGMSVMLNWAALVVFGVIVLLLVWW